MFGARNNPYPRQSIKYQPLQGIHGDTTDNPPDTGSTVRYRTFTPNVNTMPMTKRDKTKYMMCKCIENDIEMPSEWIEEYNNQCKAPDKE